MSHVTEERLAELGLSLNREPTEEEAAHLSRCGACASSLARDRALTQSLECLPQPETPPDFVGKAMARVSRAEQRAPGRSWLLLLIAALLSASALVVPIALILVANFSAVCVGVATGVEYLVAAVHLVSLAASKLAAALVGTLAVTALAGVVGAGVVGHALGADAAVK
ncbi:MAG: hypothetical protein HY903_19510 [Deltaproteobacteria bacterium]|nr:hypothetical protein [Deltaproteobacteria bacterium]